MEASDAKSEDPVLHNWEEDIVGDELSKNYHKIWELRKLAYVSFFEQFKQKKVKLNGMAKKKKPSLIKKS